MAFRWYLRAARNGDLDSLAEVARCYYYGIGTAENHTQALNWYLKAAIRGQHKAAH